VKMAPEDEKLTQKSVPQKIICRGLPILASKIMGIIS